MRAFRAGRRTAGDRPLAWLLRVARNLWADHLRRQGRAASESLDQLSEIATTDPALSRLEQDAGVLTRMRHLPLAWQHALILRHMHDLSVAEVADILDVPQGTVKTWLHRGRARLAGWVAVGEVQHDTV